MHMKQEAHRGRQLKGPQKVFVPVPCMDFNNDYILFPARIKWFIEGQEYV